MNKIKLTTTQLFVVAFLLCGLMIIQTPAAPTLLANGKIAFTSDRDGNSEIYLMNADGTGQTRLTNSPDSEDYPTWSPDGSKIAFVKQNGGVFSINLINANGTNQTELTRIIPWNTSLPSQLFSMSWSPDGAKIAFQDSTDIFTINVDGSNRVNLTNGQFINYGPSWSPDGSRIAFARSPYSHGYYPNVCTMNADGSNVRQIASCQGYCATYAPDWSPDSGRIAFTFNGDSDYDAYTIALVNPDETNLQHIISGGVEHPKWSPDGTKIVSYSGGYSNIPSQIWVINRNGSGQTQLTNASSNNFHPDWQPLTPELGLIVTRSDDRNNAACVPGDCSLREAVNAANASATDDTINFASGLTTITLTNEIIINNAGTLNINGLGANVLTINGGAGTNRIFYTNSVVVTISGVTLTGGGGTGATNSGGGGAIYAFEGSLTLDGVHVTGNSLSVEFFGAAGGGLYFFFGTHRIINSTISGNTARSGGGIFNSASLLTIINSTISGNTASTIGGGIAIYDGSATLRNVTVTNNTAQQGGGIYQYSGGGLLLILNFGNIILAGNTATSGSAPEILSEFNTITSAGGNLFGDSPGDSANILTVYQPTDIRDTNPMLGALQNNGGTTPTHALLAGSPIIDKGLNRLVSPLAPAFDQRGTGFARFRDGNGDNIATADIGAFEVQLGGSTSGRTTPFDFDGDGKSDISVFRPSSGVWYLNRSTQGFSATQFGLATDKLAPADYDGDGKTDIAVYRDGTWYLLRSTEGFTAFQFGIAEDIPQPADFDGDGRAELAVYRPSNGTWYVFNLLNNQFSAVQFGIPTDKPVVGDYDGDNRADYAVYRPSEGIWYLLRSTQGFTATQFGIATDVPTPGDYDADGRLDIAVYRPSNGVWYLLRSSQGFMAFQWGISTDVPAPADYDGDGRTDLAVYRNGTWYLQQSTDGVSIQQFGLANDKPAPAAYLP